MFPNRILRSPDAVEGGGPVTEGGEEPTGPETIEPADEPAPRRDEDAGRIAALERRALESERALRAALQEKELATALAGRPLVPGGSDQLIRLWRDDFD